MKFKFIHSTYVKLNNLGNFTAISLNDFKFNLIYSKTKQRYLAVAKDGMSKSGLRNYSVTLDSVKNFFRQTLTFSSLLLPRAAQLRLTISFNYFFPECAKQIVKGWVSGRKFGCSRI